MDGPNSITKKHYVRTVQPYLKVLAYFDARIEAYKAKERSRLDMLIKDFYDYRDPLDDVANCQHAGDAKVN